nr:hypothetical protein [Tanacetum cinerariifolium]
DGARAGGAGAGGAGAGGAGAGGAGVDGVGAGGAGVGSTGPTAPEITGCTYITFMKFKPHPFKGTECTLGLCQWFEKLEYVFRISDCKERDKVKFATTTLQVYAWVVKKILGDVTSSRHAGIDEAVCIAYQLMGQIIQDKTYEVSEGEKRKGEGDRGGRGDNQRDYNRQQNQRRVNAGAMINVAPNDNEVCPKCKNKKHGGDCWKCGKCGKLGNKIAACWSLDIKDVTCFNCNEKGNRKRGCPKLKKNGQGMDQQKSTDDEVWIEPIDNIYHECEALRFKSNLIRYQDYEWYDALEDSNLKNEALINKAILEKSMNEEEESSDDAWSHYSPIDE